MPRTRTVVDCSRWGAHRAALLGGESTDHLEAHTAEAPYTPEEDALADTEQAQARAERDARYAAREQAQADVALLREHGAGHPDPVVQAAARLLARGG